MLENAQL